MRENKKLFFSWMDVFFSSYLDPPVSVVPASLRPFLSEANFGEHPALQQSVGVCGVERMERPLVKGRGGEGRRGRRLIEMTV